MGSRDLETQPALETLEPLQGQAPPGYHAAMKIGELAAATQTAVDTIRYYEREGLLPEPTRSGGNYRVYGPAQAQRLGFIRHCRTLDMTLDEVRELLRLQDAPGRDCGEVDALLDRHIGHVAERMRELRSLHRQLQALRQRCGGDHRVSDCGILDGLHEAAVRPARSASHVPGAAAREPRRR
jgi:Cd(II)/Pb(II)-responsive transcriptional regulator